MPSSPDIDLDTWYRRFGPMVFRRCRRMLGDDAAAHDALQDTFVQVLRAGDRLTGAAPSSLLFRTATHVCLNRLRTRRRHPEHTVDTAGSEGGDPARDLLERIAAVEDNEARSAARAALAWLFDRHPESTRTLAVLHLYDGLTLEEVAAESGLSVSGVKKRLRGLRASLHELERL